MHADRGIRLASMGALRAKSRWRSNLALVACLIVCSGEPGEREWALLAADPDIYEQAAGARAQKSFYADADGVRFVCVSTLTDAALGAWERLLRSCDGGACAWVTAMPALATDETSLARWLGGLVRRHPDARVIGFACPRRERRLRALMAAATHAAQDVRVVADLSTQHQPASRAVGLGSRSGGGKPLRAAAGLQEQEHRQALARLTGAVGALEHAAFVCACLGSREAGREGASASAIPAPAPSEDAASPVADPELLVAFVQPRLRSVLKGAHWRRAARGLGCVEPASLRQSTPDGGASGASLASECAASRHLHHENLACADDTHLAAFLEPAGWEHYQLLDLLTLHFPWQSRACGAACERYPGSLAARYTQAQLARYDGRRTPRSVRERALLNTSLLLELAGAGLGDAARAHEEPRADAPNASVVVHVRVGDVVDSAPPSVSTMLAKQTYFNPIGPGLLRKEKPSDAYVLPLRCFSCLPARSAVTLMAAAHLGPPDATRRHGAASAAGARSGSGTPNTEGSRGSVVKTCLYVHAVRRYLEARGHTVQLRLGQPPDEDVLHALRHAWHFFYTGGKYGRSIAHLVRLRGGGGDALANCSRCESNAAAERWHPGSVKSKAHVSGP